jgi:hypothetical protein
VGHNVYANAKALDGYRTGRFPDGSVPVFDLFEAAERSHDQRGGTPRAARDAQGHERYAATAGWGWERFAGGEPGKRQVDAVTAQKCVACHARQKAHDYVFTRFEE